MPANRRLSLCILGGVALLYLLPHYHKFETPSTDPLRLSHPHHVLPNSRNNLKNLNSSGGNQATAVGEETRRLHLYGEGVEGNGGGGGGGESPLQAQSEEQTGGGDRVREKQEHDAEEKELDNEIKGQKEEEETDDKVDVEDKERSYFQPAVMSLGNETIVGGERRDEGKEETRGEEENALITPHTQKPAGGGDKVEVEMGGEREQGEGCEVTFPLSPCPCKRTVHVPLPGCKGGRVDEVVEKVKTAFGESTCSDWATVRGGEQKVVSYSVFGAFPNAYHRGIEVLAGQVAAAYPGWTMRVHHDLELSNRAQREWFCALACQYHHLDFCAAVSLSGGVGDVRGSVGSVWRAAVLGDPLIKFYAVRDADSPVLPREVEAVREWLSSGKCFHVMRDSPHHDQAVMAGLWGGCGGWHAEAMPRLRHQLFRWCPARAPLSADQLGINMLLWPLLRRNHTAHDSYHCQVFPDAHPFPTKRQGREFVGMRSLRPHHAHDALTTPCPAQCRPTHHRNWTFC